MIMGHKIPRSELPAALCPERFRNRELSKVKWVALSPWNVDYVSSGGRGAPNGSDVNFVRSVNSSLDRKESIEPIRTNMNERTWTNKQRTSE